MSDFVEPLTPNLKAAELVINGALMETKLFLYGKVRHNSFPSFICLTNMWCFDVVVVYPGSSFTLLMISDGLTSGLIHLLLLIFAQGVLI